MFYLNPISMPWCVHCGERCAVEIRDLERSTGLALFSLGDWKLYTEERGALYPSALYLDLLSRGSSLTSSGFAFAWFISRRCFEEISPVPAPGSRGGGLFRNHEDGSSCFLGGSPYLQQLLESMIRAIRGFAYLEGELRSLLKLAGINCTLSLVGNQ